MSTRSPATLQEKGTTAETPAAEPRGIIAPCAEPLFTRHSVFCVLLLAACLLAAWPVVNLGITDDWSYIRTAQLFAHTGHFVYNGWATAILGWQVLWGALFARLVGPSFIAIRSSALPIDLATALFYHAVLRRFGLNKVHATFGTLTLVLSPLFFPLAATFMSDVPGFFPIVLCLYFCQLALAARTDRAARAWLITAALTNIVLGTARQTAWLGVLVIVPSCAWLLRRRRYVVPLTIILWIVGVLSIHFTIAWFLRQPYSVPEKIITSAINLSALERLLDHSFRGVLTTLLLCLPVLATGFGALFPLRRGKLIRAGVLVYLFSAVLALLKLQGRSTSIEPPWLGTTVDFGGVRATLEHFSPHSDPAAGMMVFLFFCLLCLWAFVETLDHQPIQPAPRQPQIQQPQIRQPQIQWRSASVLMLPFLFSYCVLLIPRSAFVDTPEHDLWDRYLLLIVAVLLFYMLAWHQERVSPRLPAIAILVLIGFGSVAVASTHDLFARERARVRLLEEIQRAGVPRTAIRGGFAFDAITQLDAWGYVNESAIVNPPGAYHPRPFDFHHCGYWFNSFVPAIHARYEIETEPNGCVTPAPFPPVSYRTWLPPRTLIVWAGTLPASPNNPSGSPSENAAP